MAAAQQEAKIRSIVDASLTEGVKNLKNHITASDQEILIKVEEINVKLAALEALLAAKKAPKKTTGSTDTAPGTTPDGATAAEPVASKFHINKLQYFRSMYKEDEAFRVKYTTPTVEEDISHDPQIAACKTEQQKITKKATAAYNSIKTKDPKLFEEIDADYKAAKAAHDNAKPQEAEAHSE